MEPERRAPAWRESWSIGVAMGRMRVMRLSTSLRSRSSLSPRVISVVRGAPLTIFPVVTGTTTANAQAQSRNTKASITVNTAIAAQ